MNEKHFLNGCLFCLCGAAGYLFGSNIAREAKILESIPRIGKLKELANKLNSECISVPLVVAISGRAGSETPIECEFGGLKGVVVAQKVVQEVLKRNSKGEWVKDWYPMLFTSKEVPWYLDDGTCRVNVMRARSASGFGYPASNGVFEQAKRCCDFVTSDDPESIKILGVTRVEKVLPVGSYLNVVGEAVKDDTGTIRIQRPNQGPFYVTSRSIDGFIEESRSSGWVLKVVSLGFIVLGVILIVHEVMVELEGYPKPQWRRFVDAALKRSWEGIKVRFRNGCAGFIANCNACLQKAFTLLPTGFKKNAGDADASSKTSGEDHEGSEKKALDTSDSDGTNLSGVEFQPVRFGFRCIG